MFSLLLAATFAVSDGGGLESATPKSVGMSAARLETIDRVVARGIREGGYPGAAVVVGRKGKAVWERGFGHLDWTSTSPAVDPATTIYDLASLTKVVGTTTAAMILFDEGLLHLDAYVRYYIPEFSGGWKDSVTIRQLLTHRSGLPAGRDLWRISYSPEEARRYAIGTDLAYIPGTRYIYSDLGADLLGFVVETVARTTLDVFLDQRVFGPLGMENTFFRPADSLVARIAPTEVMPPRGYPLRGEVHDENAYALGGVAGHAGLFSTAQDLSVFAQMLLNGGEFDGVRIVSDSAVRLFTTRTAGTRALGWDTADGDGGSGQYLSGSSYGHTGYTGTSLWIDPEREMFVILLTNRVHAARARRPAKVISDVRADLSDAAALAVLDYNDTVLAMPASFRADRAVGWNRPTAAEVRRSRSKRKKRPTAKRTRKKSSAKASPRKTSSTASARKPAAGSN